MSLTYLQACVRTRQECKVSGSGPVAVTGQAGDLKKIVDYVADAYREIQNRYPNWRWLRSAFTVNTTLGDDAYAPTDCTDSRLSSAVSRFSRWILTDDYGCSNLKIYLTSSGVGGERWLSVIPWGSFRAIYKIGTQTNGPPAHATIDPQNNLVLGPKPDGVYTVTGEYQMSAQELAANSDAMEMPGQFHMLAVYLAMEKWGQDKGQTNVFNRGSFEGNRMMRQLEANQLPELCMGVPLA